MLPSGPRWKYQTVPTTISTKSPIRLYFRDPLECLEEILRSPLLTGHIEFDPYRVYSSCDKNNRIYSEWLSGNAAWDMQARPCSINFP
jgi:hypothetical protein